MKQEDVEVRGLEEAGTVLTSPVIVHLKRNAKQKRVVQGCTLWLGHKCKFNGEVLVESPLANPFNGTHSVIDGRYEAYMRTLLHYQPHCLDVLTGQVAGCECTLVLPNGLACPGELLLRLWKEAHPHHITPFPAARAAEVVTLPTAVEEQACKSQNKNKEPAGGVEQTGPPEVKRRKQERRAPAIRTHLTHPEGLRGEDGQIWPWPKLDDETISYGDTIYLDEAGRGPLAGPMTIGAVVLLKGFDVVGLHDSKLLTDNELDTAYDALMQSPFISATVISISAFDIDREGMRRAWPNGMIQAIKTHLEQSESQPQETKDSLSSSTTVITQAVIDGNQRVAVDGVEVSFIEKGDRKHVGIAAAAVLAKVTRDREMIRLSQLPACLPFKQVFAKSKAYGTLPHRDLIRNGQYTDVHRRSFAPLRLCLLRSDYPQDAPLQLLDPTESKSLLLFNDESVDDDTIDVEPDANDDL